MIDNKVIVVTGGAGRIGKEFIKAVVESNGTAIIADIDLNLGLNLKKELSKDYNPDKIINVEIDITSEASIQKVIDFLHEKYGKIDGLVNNAYPRNKNYGNHFFDVRYEDFMENLGINLGGYFLTSQLFSKYFFNQGFGNIVNVSSIYGVIPPKFDIYDGTKMTTPVEYAAIKSGLIHLTKYMAAYFKGKNIRVNTLSPGGILDNQPESFLIKYKNNSLNKGMLNASDLKGTLIFLLSDMSKFVNGQNIVVDDGFTL